MAYTELIEYEKYLNIPFKHLGDTLEGMDCFNLCKHIYKQELNIELPLSTYDVCNIVDDDWYQKTTVDLFLTSFKSAGFEKTSEIKPYTIAVFSIGSTNIANHCGIFINSRQFIHTMTGKTSFLSRYAGYYQQYTVGLFKCALKT